MKMMPDATMKHRRTGYVVSLLLMMVMSAMGGTSPRPGEAPAPPPFTVEGLVGFEWYSKAGSKTYPAFHFSVTVDGCRWLIHEECEDKSLYDYDEVYYDGQFLYSLRSFQSVVEDLVRRTGVRGASNVATAITYKGQVFRDEFAHVIGPLWLAYASGCYWPQLTNTQVEPVAVFTSKGPRTSAKGSDGFRSYQPLRQNAVWNCSQEEPHLPLTVAYFSEDGNTNSLYSVLATTNLSGTRVPLQSTFSTFWDEDQAELSPADKVLIRYSIRLTSIRVAAPLSAQPPPLPGLTAIADFRFAKTVGLLGIWSNRWLSEQEATNTAEYARAIGQLRATKTRPRGQLTFRLLVGCTLALPLAVLAKQLFGRRSKKHSTN
jgi:hypothetical protein